MCTQQQYSDSVSVMMSMCILSCQCNSSYRKLCVYMIGSIELYIEKERGQALNPEAPH